MGDYVKEVTDQSFEQEVLQSSQPVLVDFWAEWCQPCRVLAPTVEAVAEKYDGKARFFKINVDENPSVPQNYGIKGIPTLILFKGGSEADRVVGITSRENIFRMIDRALGAEAAESKL
ncbi:MAG TPA: thioredoxin [Blastocatellia bacterium]|nr:thioredoxin [Blastocatellia bacterium]